jgi:hypothetical protein
MGYKQPSSGLPFKELGSSPAKQIPKGFNMEGSKFSKANTPGFKDTKIAKNTKIAKKNFNKFQSQVSKGRDWAKKILKKGGTKTIGVLGLMGGDPLSATASDARTKTEGEQIKDLLTKHNLKGGN